MRLPQSTRTARFAAMSRLTNTFAGLTLVLLATGCGGSGDSDTGTGTDAALGLATEACNSMLKTPSDDAESLTVSEDAASVAATAAESDEKWDALATAMSVLASERRLVVELTAQAAAGEDITAGLATLMDSTAGPDVVAQCRKVLAAGGKVNEADLQDFGSQG